MSDDPGRVAAVLAATGPVLLDFDGPVCAVYPGDLNRRASDEMRQQLRQGGATYRRRWKASATPSTCCATRGTLDQRDVVAALDKTLAAIEVEAVPSAPHTHGSTDFLEACAHSGRAIAIVSSNAPEAIQAHLDLHSLSGVRSGG
jgi:phosphoglycolate phosphatase